MLASMIKAKKYNVYCPLQDQWDLQDFQAAQANLVFREASVSCMSGLCLGLCHIYLVIYAMK